mmetsp:Transcript_18901/g.32522  ORF Transcript_18901/g.32522 Transcript_18901/m.32522 type:complete len:350 (-) Transcript_18901:509-1558(-)
MLVHRLLHLGSNHRTGHFIYITQYRRTQHTFGHFRIGMCLNGKPHLHLHIGKFGYEGYKSFFGHEGPMMYIRRHLQISYILMIPPAHPPALGNQHRLPIIILQQPKIMPVDIPHQRHALEPTPHFTIRRALRAPFPKEGRGRRALGASGELIEESLGGTEVVDAFSAGTVVGLFEHVGGVVGEHEVYDEYVGDGCSGEFWVGFHFWTFGIIVVVAVIACAAVVGMGIIVVCGCCCCCILLSRCGFLRLSPLFVRRKHNPFPHLRQRHDPRGTPHGPLLATKIPNAIHLVQALETAFLPAVLGIVRSGPDFEFGAGDGGPRGMGFGRGGFGTEVEGEGGLIGERDSLGGE